MRETKHSMLYKTALAISLAAAAVFLCSCHPGVKKRPIGWVHLAKLSEINEPELEFPGLGLLLRQDAGGFYVMSTWCTHDLSPLERKPGPDGQPVLVARNGSVYSLGGEVLKGPAKAPLPYYELRLDRSSYDGPFEMLYAFVGMEKPKSYRLNLRGK